MLPTTPVYAIFSDSGGELLQGVVVTVTLDRSDVTDNGYVVPRYHRGTTGTDGRVDFALWPNERGVTESSYVVRAWSPSGERLLNVVANVPDTDTEMLLGEIAAIPSYPGKSEEGRSLTAANEAEAFADAAEQHKNDAADSATAAGNSESTTSALASQVSTAESNVEQLEQSASASAAAAATSESNTETLEQQAGTHESNAEAAKTEAENASSTAQSAAISASADADTASTKADETQALFDALEDVVDFQGDSALNGTPPSATRIGQMWRTTSTTGTPYNLGDFIIYRGGDNTDFSSFSRITGTPPVRSVAGKTGAVTLAKGDVGLGQVLNQEIRITQDGATVDATLAFDSASAELSLVIDGTTVWSSGGGGSGSGDEFTLTIGDDGGDRYGYEESFFGSLSPTEYNNDLIIEIAYNDFNGELRVLIDGAYLADYFTSITVDDGAGGSEIFETTNATHDGVGPSEWVWTGASLSWPSELGNDVTVTIT